MELNRFSRYTKEDIDFLKWRIEVPYVNKLNQDIYDLIFQDKPENILEVGCGEAITLYFKNPLNYVGVDKSLSRLQIASIKNKKYKFIQGDGISLPFKSEKFDLVFCMGTLHHLSKNSSFLMMEEMLRVCKEGGMVTIIEPNVYNPISLLFGLIREQERGILHCNPNVFLKYLKKLGLGNLGIKLEFIGTCSLICIISYLFKRRSFIKSLWFQKIWGCTDYIVNKIIPKRLWSNMIIVVKKHR